MVYRDYRKGPLRVNIRGGSVLSKGYPKVLGDEVVGISLILKGMPSAGKSQVPIGPVRMGTTLRSKARECVRGPPAP